MFSIDKILGINNNNNNNESISSAILSGSRISAPKRGTKELLMAYSASPWIRGVVGKVAHNIAMTEWKLFAVKGKKEERFRRHKQAQMAKGNARKKILKKLHDNHELTEIDDHPLLDLLNGGNVIVNGLNTNKLNQIYIDLIGESFLLKERDALGVPIGLWPIIPTWVRELPTSLEGHFKVQFHNRQLPVPVKDMVWITDPDPLMPYQRGSGIGKALGDEIEIDEFTSKYIKDFFYNGARPDIIVTADGLGKEDTRRLENDFNNRNQGVFKRFKAHFFNTKVEVKTINQDIRAMKIADLRKLERDIIMQVYGLPPEIMGVVENSNRATIDGADYIFSRWVLVPRLELLRTVYQDSLVPDFDERLILDYTSPIAQDKEFKLDVVKTAPWAFSVDEIRELGGVGPKEDDIGKIHLKPFNMTETDLIFTEETFSPPVVDLPEDKKDKSIKKDLLNTSEISSLVNSIDPKRFNDALSNSLSNMISSFGQDQLDELENSLVFNLQSDAVEQFIKVDTANRFAVKINRTTREALRKQLLESVAENETIVQLTSRVSDVFDIAVGSRARMIARTESVRISNFGAVEGMKQGFVEGKGWLSSRDTVVRDSHLPGIGLDGSEVLIGSNFKSPITGAEGPFPGSLGLASEDINCRCSVLAILNMDGKQFTEEQKVAIWKNFESRRMPFERVLIKDIRKAFKLQRSDVLAKLSNLIGD